MTPRMQERFDGLLEGVIDALPASYRSLLDEIPVIVMDRPSRDMIRDLRRDGTLPPEGDDEEEASSLCGLHTGVPGTERSVELSGDLPSQIHLFREGIVALAGGWDGAGADEAVAHEIRVTLLHELGHQFGLEEGDLDELGYG